MRRTMHVLVLGCAIVTGAQRSSAQALQCDRSESANQCYDRERARLKKVTTKVKDSATKSVAPKVAAKPTGSEPSSANGSTSIKDFLPTLASALSLPGADKGKGLDLLLNFKANDPVWRLPAALQLKATSTQPKLNSALVKNIPSARRAAVEDSMNKTLGDLDDVAVSTALNAESKQWGRSAALHADDLSTLVQEILAASEPNVDALDIQLRDMVSALVLTGQGPECSTTAVAKGNKPLHCFDAPSQSRVDDVVAKVARGIVDLEATEKKALAESHFDQVDNLINNQKQFNATAKYLVRKNEIGPREGTATLRLEYSPVSLSAVHDYCAARNAGNDALHAACFTEYMSQPGIIESVQRGDRVWAIVDFSHTNAYDFALAADSARVTKPQSWAIEPALGYGGYLLVSGQRLHLDGELRYRQSLDESVRQNRWSFSASLTQKVSDEANTILTFKWVDHPEFLGDVDKKLSANVGISLKMPDAKKGQ